MSTLCSLDSSSDSGIQNGSECGKVKTHYVYFYTYLICMCHFFFWRRLITFCLIYCVYEWLYRMFLCWAVVQDLWYSPCTWREKWYKSKLDHRIFIPKTVCPVYLIFDQSFVCHCVMPAMSLCLLYLHPHNSLGFLVLTAVFPGYWLFLWAFGCFTCFGRFFF